MFNVQDLIFFMSTIHTWVLIVSIGTLGFFLFHREKFYNKFLLYSYVLFILLFAAESIRSLYVRIFGLDVLIRVPSFVLGLFVIVFLAYLSYYYSQRMDVTQIFGMSSSKEKKFSDGFSFEEIDLGQLREGFIHLIKDETSEYAFKVFRKAVTDIPGACFTRKAPRKIKKKYQLEKTPITWFKSGDEIEGEHNIIEPMRTNFLRETITKFVKKHDRSIILLEGIEFLLVKNSFEKVLHFLQGLADDLSGIENATLLIALNPDVLDSKKLAMLEEEVDEILNGEKV